MNRTSFVVTLLAGAWLAPSAPAAQQATARDRYYEAAGDDTDAQVGWRGVRTSILLRRERKGKDPIVREVGENFGFLSGDSFRLRIESNFDGYLYLFLRDSSGGMKLLFPYEGSKAKSNHLAAFEARSIPGRRMEWFRFDQEAGIEQVFLFVSPAPIDALERLQKGNRTPLLRELERVIAKNGAPDFMRFDEEDLEDGGDQGATYYVERSTARRQFLVRRIELLHDAE